MYDFFKNSNCEITNITIILKSTTMDAKGTKDNPYSMDEYKHHAGKWTGGWVKLEKKVVYINSLSAIEQDLDGMALGSSNNPFSEEAYDEMRARNEWPGGYVQFHGISDPSYRRSSAEEKSEAYGCGDESGCGSDSEGGSGSGRGHLTPGSEIIHLIKTGIEDIQYEAEVSWTAEGDVSVVITSPPHACGSIENVKVNGYDVEIPWNGFTVHYTIPEFYREG